MSEIVPDVRPVCTLDAVQGGNRRSIGQSLAAVLFDMDGTLVETEQYWGEAMAALAERLGGRLSRGARERTVGTSMRFALSVLYEDVGVLRNDEQLLADGRWVEERTRELMAAGAPWRPGARDLVLETRASGLPTALVTTTPRRLASVVLEQLVADLGADPFDVTVCGDEVPARKPDPAPYLQAAAALGVDVERCAVVEDSLAGVTSALAAGAAVLGVPSLQPLAAAPGLTLRPSLVGVRPADLAALVAEREQDDPAA
jgi:HAD superfamily hydrolase (TIGR01509 family)